MTPTKSRGVHPDAYARLEAENASLRQQVQTLREACEEAMSEMRFVPLEAKDMRHGLTVLQAALDDTGNGKPHRGDKRR